MCLSGDGVNADEPAEIVSPPKDNKPALLDAIDVGEGAYLTKGKEAKTKSQPERKRKPDIDLVGVSREEMKFYGDLFRENTDKLL